MHTHNFQESERFFTTNSPNLIDFSGNAKALERLAFGVTTILYRCTICGKPKTVEIAGGSECQNASK